MQSSTQRLSLDVGHGVERHVADFARVENFWNSGMIELGRECDLTEESLDHYCAADVLTENFNSYVIAGAIVGAEVHRRHAALSELALDGVVLTDRRQFWRVRFVVHRLCRRGELHTVDVHRIAQQARTTPDCGLLRAEGQPLRTADLVRIYYGLVYAQFIRSPQWLSLSP